MTTKVLFLLGGDIGDATGAANGVGTGSFADIVGHPKTGFDREVGDDGPRMYNVAAYADPCGLTFGDSARNSLRLPRTTNFDAGLRKRFPIHEAIGFEFFRDVFNLFNHTEFNAIDGSFSRSRFFEATRSPSRPHQAIRREVQLLDRSTTTSIQPASREAGFFGVFRAASGGAAELRLGGDFDRYPQRRGEDQAVARLRAGDQFLRTRLRAPGPGLIRMLSSSTAAPARWRRSHRTGSTLHGQFRT